MLDTFVARMDQQLKIKSYTPEGSNYAPRIGNEQWNQYKPLLKSLHDAGYKRAAMLDELQGRGFNPSMGQLNAKMTSWGFKVYGTHSDTQEREVDKSLRLQQFHSTDATMTDYDDRRLTVHPSPQRSTSSLTLCEPEIHWRVPADDENLTLDEVIILQGLSLTGSYWPSVKPPDFGFRSQPLGTDPGDLNNQHILAVADFLCAVHCFESAFDLYFHVFEHLITKELVHDNIVIRGLIQCAMSATTNAQCAYVLPIVQRSQVYCTAHGMTELGSCFASLFQDLCTQETKESITLKDFENDHPINSPLLVLMDPKTCPHMLRKEILRDELHECDSRCSTLAHLSMWCQDTLSFFDIENKPIGKLVSTPARGTNGTILLEQEFQILARALIIDYLNSPGPSMRKANVECREDHCPFRWTLSPSTSLIIMAHMLHEPLWLQTQTTGDEYLHVRAQQYAMLQATTASQELKAFASADSTHRCSAFVDVYVKHFNTNLSYRRFVTSVNSVWDRHAAAKRMGQLLQGNQAGLLPHAGLPSARRSVLKTMAAPFGLDQGFLDNRASITWESGSMGEFAQLASQIGNANRSTGSYTPSDAMSIDTHSSWSFHRVTGFSQGPFSARNSLSSRRDPEEIDEYHHFVKDNNYNQRNTPTDPDTPTQGFSKLSGRQP